ncbi:DNA-binding IclR family transcriptional regulator [Spinactinospora alkalitolerans]|uniref:DNA-binding IclR family transcriptional regulator n=1 Tax=Spinactinospora alkalitolerans TaxID=687207 RepID=A0A852TX92_9ACTN|nr:IclR family transcriptional regulator [Spinactinospora alkalitolerans]NYE47917.1 DNA-binding IclR family transcriptional regulator [Spinactinospora alkalitolerans]
MAESPEPADMTNKSVVKAVRLLRELAKHRQGATATALAAATRIARPTAFRLLYSLEQNGFVDRIDNNYILGWELARLGKIADPHAGLVRRVQPVLDDLAAELNETATMSIPLGDDDFELIAEAASSHLVGVTVGKNVGRHFPLHASSTGKILLAELPKDRIESLLPPALEAFASRTITDRGALLKELAEVREQGYSVIDNEFEEGLLSLSRPVRDSSGKLAAILTAEGPRYRLSRDRIPEALQHMQATVGRIVGILWEGSTPD